MEKEESIIKHLMNSAFLFPENDTFSVMLKSHLLTQCLEMSQYKFKLPYNVFNKNVRCSNCCTAWDDKKFTSKMVKNNVTKSAKKRLKSIIKDRNKSLIDVNAAREKLHKNKLIINCLVCSKPTEIVFQNKYSNNNKKINNTEMQTPIRSVEIQCKSVQKNKIDKKRNQKSFYQSMNKTPETTPLKNTVVPISAEKSSNKKKRNKDKFAGLCKVACSSFTLESPEVNRRNSNPLHLLLKGNGL